MTIVDSSYNVSESSDSSGEVVHETQEDCKSYISSIENLVRAEASLTESVRLADNGSQERLLSSPLIIRGLPWKLYLVQNYQQGQDRILFGIVLCDANLPSPWTCSAKCTVTLRNFQNPLESMMTSFTNTFLFRLPKHNIENIIFMKDLYSQKCPFVENGRFEVSLHIRAEAPHGIIWDSRTIAGYVGLRNQGATCYLNSLLQTLFFAEPLRQLIYRVPTEVEDRDRRSVASALQRIFYELQQSKFSVDTRRLTNAFGWDTRESYVQHDVQEMCRILLDKLEEKMKGTLVEDGLAKLLEGKLISYIRCVNVEYESRREESFYDIQLNVQNKKDIYQSFDDYIAEETFQDDNKYHAGVYGLQVAKKGIVFKNLPPILHLHLLRFQYDPYSNVYYKVNDRFEFPTILNLDKYLIEPDPKSSAIYRLQSVLVHSGDQHGGHYVVFISPKCDNVWYKFDDDIVSRVSGEEAVDENYGHAEGNVRYCSNAYMLAYVRESVLKDASLLVSSSDIPPHIVKEYDIDEEVAKCENEYREDIDNYIEINVTFDDHLFSFDQNHTIDFMLAFKKAFVFCLALSAEEVVCSIAEKMGVKREHLRIFMLTEYLNKQPFLRYISSEHLKLQLKNFVERFGYNFFIQTLSSAKPFSLESDVVLFVHRFCKDSQRVDYCGIVVANKSMQWNHVVELACKTLGLRFSDPPLVFYEEEQFVAKKIETNCEYVNAAICDEFCCSKSIVLQENTDGDMMTFNADTMPFPFRNAKEFLNYVKFRVTVIFCDVNACPEEPHFALMLYRTMKYRNYAEAVAAKCGVDWTRIRLYKCRAQQYSAVPIRSTTPGILDEVFLSLNRSSDHQKLYYQILDFPIHEVDDKAMLYVAYSILRSRESGHIPLFVFPDCSLADVKEAARKELIRTGHELRNDIRIVEFNDRHFVIFSLEKDVHNFFVNFAVRNLRVEEVPDDQLCLGNDHLVCVGKLHTAPQPLAVSQFFIRVGVTTTCAEMLARIRMCADASDLSCLIINTYRSDFSNVGCHSERFPKDTPETALVSDFIPFLCGKPDVDHVLKNVLISLDHSSTSVSPRQHRAEKMLKIHG